MHGTRRIVVAGLVLVSLWHASVAAAATHAAPSGHGGAVASQDQRASEVGVAALREGGNAVDAAVATALALAVVFPEAGNLGGGGFAVLRVNGEFFTLDFREVAPAAAHARMFLDAKGEPIPDASEDGALAAGVPGSPAGLHELHRRFGKLPWKRVVEPARRLAADGFVVGLDLRESLTDPVDRPRLEKFAESKQTWYPGGDALVVGSTVKLPQLARTLERYAEQGATGITTGPVAEAIVATSKKYGGILTTADLAAYKPAWREPLRFERFGWKFAAMPLPSSGGTILAATLSHLDRWGWSATPRFGAERAHLLAESFRRAFADRYLLGDPSTTEARPEDLLDEGWLARSAASLDRRHATPSQGIARWSATGKRESTETTHLSVIDRDGNVVALTTTLNDTYGGALYVPEAGFFLNDEMDDFSTVPGKPNMYGLVQGPANEVAAGKRMLSSMTPTIAWRTTPGGDEVVALGGRGGSRIPTAVTQTLLAIFEGDSLQAAIDRPRIHHQTMPDVIEAELDALQPETRAEVERRGHRVEPPILQARVIGVHRWSDGRVEAAADARGPGGGAIERLDPP
jgi:gamma-glutamyltranspeptidase/glutathione hydrolase